MSGLDQVDVSRLSIAECLALAKKQDTDREDAAEADLVEGILERIAKSAAGVTQAVGECSLDLGLLARGSDVSAAYSLPSDDWIRVFECDRIAHLRPLGNYAYRGQG
eukprot:COSAG02_NODE_14726_length_1242_cov_13.224847_2_plen_107_part_00